MRSSKMVFVNFCTYTRSVYTTEIDAELLENKYSLQMFQIKCGQNLIFAIT